MRRNSSQSRRCWIALVGVTVAAAAVMPARASRHAGTQQGTAAAAASRTTKAIGTGLGATDALVACGMGLLEKPVFLSMDSAFFDEPFTCPVARAAFAPAMRGLGLRVFESADSAVLIPEWAFESKGTGLYYAWKDIAVQIVAGEFQQTDDGAPVVKAPQPDEREPLVKAIYRSARTPPLGRFEMGPSHANTSISESVTLTPVEVVLKPDVRSIVAVWGNEFGLRRVVYGEIVDGRYNFAWDTPVISGLTPTLAFEDVDGDGVKEICVSTRIGRDSMLVSIFSRTGIELTRQDECLTEWVDDDRAKKPTSACPVVGEYVALQPPVNGRRDLQVEARDGPYRLVLKGKRYVKATRP
jgi:hypothetical protein